MGLYRTFDAIVEGYEETDETIRDWVRGFVFGECEVSEESQSISHVNYLDEVDGIEIYYCYGADHYFFCPVDLDEWT